MALDKETLREAVKAAFKKAKETPPPDPPDEGVIKQLQETILTDLAQDLADALDAFVRGADVTGVQVEVRNNASVVIGSGTQNNLGQVQ
ncbi:MAG TPA: hypothetical protein VF591_25935 [Pyrinomonadaceae bacterium]|jgi:hypothetical protein